MKKIFYLISTLGVSVVNVFEDDSTKEVKKDAEEKVVEISTDENREVFTDQDFAFPMGEIVANNQEESEGENVAILKVNEEVDQEKLEALQTTLDSVENVVQQDIEEVILPVLTPENRAKTDSTDMALSDDEMRRLKEDEQRQMEEERKISRDIEISGLIMDDTRSKIGRDFYDSFTTQWNSASRPNEQYTITISEKPVRGSVSQVSVFVNDTEIMRQFVQMRTAEIEQRASQAVRRAHNFILNQDDIQRQLMEETDQMGSGIY